MGGRELGGGKGHDRLDSVRLDDYESWLRGAALPKSHTPRRRKSSLDTAQLLLVHRAGLLLMRNNKTGSVTLP